MTKTTATLALVLLTMAACSKEQAGTPTAAPALELAEPLQAERLQAELKVAHPCHSAGKYLARQMPYANDSGNRIEVYDKAEGATCEALSASPYFVWDRGDAADNDSYVGIYGDYLVIDTGTGADTSSNVIIDLKTKEVVYTVATPSNLPEISGHLLRYGFKERALSFVPSRVSACVSALQEAVDKWRKQMNITTAFRVECADCEVLLQIGEGVGVLHLEVDLRTLEARYLPQVGCSFFE